MVVRLEVELSWSQSTSESKVAEKDVFSLNAVRDGLGMEGPWRLTEAMPASPMARSRALYPLTPMP